MIESLIIMPVKDNVSNEKVPDYSKADFDKLNEFLAGENWDDSLGDLEFLQGETAGGCGLVCSNEESEDWE